MGNRGMTLVEVMIGLAVCSFLLLGLMRAMEVASQTQNYVQMAEDASELRSQLQALLKNSFECTSALQGKTIDTAKLKISQNLAAPVLIKASPSDINLSTFSFGRLKVKDLKLNLVHPIPSLANAYNAALEVYTESNLENSLLLAPRSIALVVRTNGGVIESCSSGDMALQQRCGPGLMVAGITADGGLICDELPPPTTIVNNNTTVIQNPAPASNPPPPSGMGCVGPSCKTLSQRPCDGNNCVTNGKFCSGQSCAACGVGAACQGSNCCAGPQCIACQVLQR